MAIYTAFCQQPNGRGTIWINNVEADSLEQATVLACEDCACDWACEPEEVHCLGIAEGDVTILYWDDVEG